MCSLDDRKTHGMFQTVNGLTCIAKHLFFSGARGQVNQIHQEASDDSSYLIARVYHLYPVDTF